MSDFPKISVVTPNFNQKKFIEKTILSVLDQGYPNLEYIIIDGASTDGSQKIIEKYRGRLAYYVSEFDKGMYDAINKGFAKSSGEIMCWINSDDVLAEKSLFTIAKLFRENITVNWIMGYPININEEGTIILQGQGAKVFSPYFFYLHNHLRGFSFIQQESCVWRRSLWEKVGNGMDLSYSLASDFDLWLRFFKQDKLYFSKQQFAAFRKREGQQSENKEKYLSETNLAVSRNQEKLPFTAKLVIWYLKTFRKLMFIPKSKKLKNYFYKFQNRFFGDPLYVKE